MSATADHYDIIVIGSGPGGAAAAQRLAPTGKRILMLERGDYLPRSRQNWDAKAVFVDGDYQTSETWYGRDGSSFHPGLHYYVGGNSKVYGAALFRLRERDFGEVRHKDGISPAWPLGYDAFEPYYTQAEALYHVHGQRGEDPTEPWSSAPYAYPPVKHEPRIQQLNDILLREGLHPFHLPLGIKLDQNPDGSATTYSPCIRCDAFDGFPCAINAKADAQVISVDPTRAAHNNFTLLTNAHVTRLETDAAGRSVSRVHVIRDNQFERYSADIVIVACGALSSALLLLRSAGGAHPNGLANGSDQVGRNYMRHDMSIVMALLKEPNHTVFQKTLALSDFYFGVGRLGFSARPHPDVRHVAWRADPRRSGAGALLAARNAVREDGPSIPSISGCKARTCRTRKTASATDGDRVVLDVQPTAAKPRAACAPSWRDCWDRSAPGRA